MSWNSNLYFYAQERGGHYLGCAEDPDDAMLLTTDRRGEPMVVDWEDEPMGRGYNSFVRVRLSVALDQPLELCIRPKTTFSKGLGAVVGVLDQGLERINVPGLGDDYGYPEVTRGRHIRTDNQAFTRLVLRDLALRSALTANPEYGITILPAVPGRGDGPAHLLEGYTHTNSSLISDTWATGEESCDLGYDRSYDAQYRRYQQGEFPSRLDALIALAQAAKDAITTYRLP